jgi:hypothetical protein
MNQKAPEIGKLALVNGIAYPVPMDTTLQNLKDRLPISLDNTDIVMFIECVVEEYPGMVITSVEDVILADHKCICSINTINQKGCQCGGI